MDMFARRNKHESKLDIAELISAGANRLMIDRFNCEVNSTLNPVSEHTAPHVVNGSISSKLTSTAINIHIHILMEKKENQCDV